jgi:hypothetical protein
MPPSAKSLAAILREKRKKGSIESKEAVNEAADPSYFGAGLPSLDNEALDVVYTAPLTGVFALDTGDVRDLSPQARETFTSEFGTNSGFRGQIFTTQLQPNSEKSPQNAQAFCAAESLGASDDFVMGDGLDLDPNLEVCELTYWLFIRTYLH